ncbi:adenine phosphoribosyltransferase [Hortaea werneckii]|uniref:adenine phosphoribosyltransferase n=1 Tax=Hortaea werneckii TaxID=91943 RepID=A0A3M7DI65_HORWE|nr:adenine phosphoribosyltransferase [Hortaea werneckii]KAI6855581.1 adenine phosphoribosyltransferase [Hortaea werneckii]KAI7344513.1 adenine phosphoribosyltransferase [Hortaea werneckii]KAI7586266.1 adenine phosphoribosyltransferase [Hortaea werneckii]KAI7594260.1 adenine phosphoribosyltransferase [Hortaea werneckii]
MSGQPVSFDQHPPHGHPANTDPSTQSTDKPSTASHPPSTKPDPTETQPHPKFHGPDGKTGGAVQDAAQGGFAAASSTGPAEQPGAQINGPELARLKAMLRRGLRQFPDWPEKGILFEDIMPLFASHALHSSLTRAMEMQIAHVFNTTTGEKSDVDVVVGLESRGFLFGPQLALRLGAGFVPVRKKGKLPGEVATETFKKEYGEDVFQMQSDAIQKGQKVVIVDDIIATGGSAAAAGNLVRKLGGNLLGYVFIMELDFLKGREKLDAPVHTLLTGQEKGLDLPLGQTKESAEEAAKPVTDAGGAAAQQQP